MLGSDWRDMSNRLGAAISVGRGAASSGMDDGRPPATLVGHTVERELNARDGVIELAEDWEAAFRDNWGENRGPVRVQRGRVGLVCTGDDHPPEVELRAYDAPPAPVDRGPSAPMETLGSWRTTFRRRTVEVWGGDLESGDAEPLRLPHSRGCQYVLRVSVGRREGGERFLVEFSPDPFAARLPSSWALSFEEPVRPPGYRELWSSDEADEPAGLYGRVVEERIGAGYGPIEIAEVRAALRDAWGRDRGRVRVQPGRIGLVSAAQDHWPEIQLSAYTSEPPPSEPTAEGTAVPLGTWPVRFKRRTLEFWSDAVYQARGPRLRLPKTTDGRYWLRVVASYPDLGGATLAERLREHRQVGEPLTGWERFIVDLWPASVPSGSRRGGGGSARVRPDAPSADSVSPVARLIERKVDASYRTIVIATDDASYADDEPEQYGPVRIQLGRIDLESAADLHAPEVQVSAYLAEPPPVESPGEVLMETLGVWPITLDGRDLRVWSIDGLPGKKTVTLPEAAGGRYLVRVAVGYRSTRGLSLEDYALEHYDRTGKVVRGIERFVVDLWPA